MGLVESNGSLPLAEVLKTGICSDPLMLSPPLRLRFFIRPSVSKIMAKSFPAILMKPYSRIIDCCCRKDLLNLWVDLTQKGQMPTVLVIGT